MKPKSAAAGAGASDKIIENKACVSLLHAVARRVGKRAWSVAVHLQLPPFKVIEHDPARARAQEQHVCAVTLHAHQNGQRAEKDADA